MFFSFHPSHRGGVGRTRCKLLLSPILHLAYGGLGKPRISANARAQAERVVLLHTFLLHPATRRRRCAPGLPLQRHTQSPNPSSSRTEEGRWLLPRIQLSRSSSRLLSPPTGRYVPGVTWTAGRGYFGITHGQRGDYYCCCTHIEQTSSLVAHYTTPTTPGLLERCIVAVGETV